RLLRIVDHNRDGTPPRMADLAARLEVFPVGQRLRVLDAGAVCGCPRRRSVRGGLRRGRGFGVRR
ncbi:hypothetical protein AB0B79_13215, partial [Streptomyces sp. NPDC039022]